MLITAYLPLAILCVSLCTHALYIIMYLTTFVRTPTCVHLYFHFVWIGEDIMQQKCNRKNNSKKERKQVNKKFSKFKKKRYREGNKSLETRSSTTCIHRGRMEISFAIRLCEPRPISLHRLDLVAYICIEHIWTK